MKVLVVDEKAIRKKMIDLNIRTVGELASKSKVSKPTIYDYLNGKSPFSSAFIRLCKYLDLDPSSVLIEVTSVKEKKNV